MSIGTPNGILDITGATLRVSKMEFRQSTGFDTVLNNVARNTMLLMDETEQTTSNSWALKLPNAWVAEFHGYWASGSSGAPILFNFYNDSTSGTNGYTLSMNDTAISINYDGGSALGSATLSSTLNNDAYRKVAVIFERSVLDVSVDGEHVFHFADSQLRDRVYDNNSGYVTFTHSSTDGRKLKNLKFTNGDKWIREIDSSNIAYVGGNVGIGTTIPGTKLDVSGTVRGTHLIGDGSAISAIQSSNVSDFGSNVTRIGTLETDLGDNSTRITNLSSNLSDNSSRITTLESGDISISGDKTFTGDIIFESNVHMNSGNVFVANTVNMTVSDPIIELGSNNLNVGDLGIIMTRHGATNSNIAIIFDESDDILRMGYTLNGANDSIVDLDSNALAMSVQGSLGVGVASPAYKLDVDGDLNLSTGSTLRINGTPAVFSNWTVSGSDIYRSSANVGVGAAPTGKFQVNVGNASAETAAWDNTKVVFGDISSGSSQGLGFGVTTNSHASIISLAPGVAWRGLEYWAAYHDWYTGGTQRMTLDSSGKVGIGTTSPDLELHVHDANAANSGIILSSTSGYHRLFDSGGQLYFQSGTAASSDSRADINFTSMYNATSYMKILGSNGNVGIGTTSPTYKLNISTDTNYDGISLRDSTRELLKIAKGNNGSYINMFDSGTSKVNISTTGSSYINGGNVGIGTTSPNRQLQIYGNSSNYFSFSPTEADDTSIVDYTNFGATSFKKQMTMRLNNRNWYWGIVNNASNYLGLAMDGGGSPDPDIQCVFQNNGTFWTKYLRVKENVGINNTNPPFPLTIGVGDGNKIQFNQDGTGTTGHNITCSSGWQLNFNAARASQDDDAKITFNISGSSGYDEMMRVTHTGVGIGNSSPGYKLDVSGDCRGYMFIANNTSSGDGDDYTLGTLENDYSAWITIFNNSWISANNGWGTFWAGNSGARYRRVSSDNNPNEYVFVGAGNKRCTFDLDNGHTYLDGTLHNNSYDYAEYFEWEDGNPENEDRRGYSVVLASDGKIRKATSDDSPEDIIGAVSGTSSITGDAAMYDWNGKYEVDEWGTRVKDKVYQLTWEVELENGEKQNHSYDEDRVPEGIIVPENASRRLRSRERINPEYDETRIYEPRDKRKEWSTIGLLGKVRVRDESPKHPNWKYLKTIAGKKLWLIK